MFSKLFFNNENNIDNSNLIFSSDNFTLLGKNEDMDMR